LERRSLGLGPIPFNDWWFSPGGGHVAVCRPNQAGDSLDIHSLADGTIVRAAEQEVGALV